MLWSMLWSCTVAGCMTLWLAIAVLPIVVSPSLWPAPGTCPLVHPRMLAMQQAVATAQSDAASGRFRRFDGSPSMHFPISVADVTTLVVKFYPPDSCREHVLQQARFSNGGGWCPGNATASVFANIAKMLGWSIAASLAFVGTFVWIDAHMLAEQYGFRHVGSEWTAAVKVTMTAMISELFTVYLNVKRVLYCGCEAQRLMQPLVDGVIHVMRLRLRSFNCSHLENYCNPSRLGTNICERKAKQDDAALSQMYNTTVTFCLRFYAKHGGTGFTAVLDHLTAQECAKFQADLQTTIGSSWQERRMEVRIIIVCGALCCL